MMRIAGKRKIHLIANGNQTETDKNKLQSQKLNRRKECSRKFHRQEHMTRTIDNERHKSATNTMI